MPRKANALDYISHDGLAIRRIAETDSEFLISFCEMASYYHTDQPALQHIIREAHAEQREISVSVDRHCEIHSAIIRPPRSFA